MKNKIPLSIRATLKRMELKRRERSSFLLYINAALVYYCQRRNFIIVI